MKRLLFSRIDNSPLVLFRICFGVLIALECFGAIATGWVRRNLIDPEFTFSFIGFEWLQPLPGAGMYLYFIVMGLLGLCIALGYRYRLSMILFTLLWCGVYLMQKTAYNNHYYLLILLSAMMCLFPAHRAVSRDVRLKPLWGENSMYAYVKWLVVAQLWIVYTFAAIAKLYPDWFDLSFVSQLMAPKAGYPIIGELLQQPWVHRGVVWFGIGYDFLVIPLLLWRPTRIFAFGASVFFHLFNAVVIQVGIFPFLSLALMVFFFDPELVRRRFFPKKPTPQPREFRIPKGAAAIVWGMGLYLALQLALPLRHHLIKGDVLWTEEGHRLSWRMMLRTRQGDLRFRVEDLRTGFKEAVRLDDYLTPDQKEKVMAYPDFIWQFARRLKEKYAAEGHEVAVYARGRLRINRRPFYPFIDETVDLASEPWDPLRHHRWILPEPTGWPGHAAESPEAP